MIKQYKYRSQKEFGNSTSNHQAVNMTATCDICAKTFASRYSMMRHKNLKHKDKDLQEEPDDESENEIEDSNGEMEESDPETESDGDEQDVASDNDEPSEYFIEDLINASIRAFEDKHNELKNEYLNKGTEANAASQKASHDLLPRYRKELRIRFTNAMLDFNNLKKTAVYRKIMDTVRKLRDCHEMDIDEAIRKGVSMRKELLNRLVDVPPERFYDGGEEKIEN